MATKWPGLRNPGTGQLLRSTPAHQRPGRIYTGGYAAVPPTSYVEWYCAGRMYDNPAACAAAPPRSASSPEGEQYAGGEARPGGRALLESEIEDPARVPPRRSDLEARMIPERFTTRFADLDRADVRHGRPLRRH